MLVVVVGRSGAGKSTFVQVMGLSPECHCVLSKPMVEEVGRRGLKVTHDNIHALAKEWYGRNRMWQVEYVLAEPEKSPKQFLVLDGLRYWFELEYLRKLFPDLLVVKVTSTPDDRFERLKVRGKIPLGTKEEFERLENDESVDMGLEQILAAADISVENIGTLSQLQEKARRFSFLLWPFMTD
ncbi:MAG: AAA family ATPase [bacterium]|nr:AAA family ATPase [bacterium]